MNNEFRQGWRNLIAATFGLGFGIPSYTAVSSLFFQALKTEFGWSNAGTAGALIALPITALTLPLVGRLIDRIGVRVMSGLSAIFLALGFVWLSMLSGVLHEYYIALIVINVLGCATGPLAYTRLVAVQFRASRGAALAIAQFGIALVAAMLPPILSMTMGTLGWRGGYLLLAILAIFGGGLAQILMQPGTRRQVNGEPIQGDDVATALRRPAFWILGIAVLFVSAASLGLVTQFQPFLVSLGLDLRTGGWLLSVFAIAVMVSRLLVGRLLDLSHPERWAALVLAVAAAGAVVLLSAGNNITLLVIGILMFGASIGAELDLMSFFCARLFGLRNYSGLYGLLSIWFYVGLAGGGISYGIVRDVTGSYTAAIIGSAFLFVISSALFLLLPRPTHSMQTAR